MERGSVWIWERGDPVERLYLLPDMGINEVVRECVPHHLTHVVVKLILAMELPVIN